MTQRTPTWPLHQPKRRNKYGARRVVVDGEAFASSAEATRYFSLELLQRAGHISQLRRQVKFGLEVNGIHICDYIADAAYIDNATQRLVVEDTKSEPTKTPAYTLKKKLMLACHGIEILETT
jgi:hypothetical protein